ncbi:MAG: presenilin family intramembrane aspartyl protease [Dehalococcoidia bacterium]|nr:presenilin family intramembrane aspartyl protease [Dehalococcoidia bacterium]
MAKKPGPRPFIWAGAIYVVCLALAFLATYQEKHGIDTGQIPPLPVITAGPLGFPIIPILYFFAATAILGLILFLIPISKLSLLLRVLFGFAFSWGSFILFWLFLQHGPPTVISFPTLASGMLALGLGILWLLFPIIWFHDLLLGFTLVSMASFFGAIFTPWTVVIVMAVVALYDFLAVRFGYMQWMTQKLSESDTLPAFFVPARPGDWNSSLRGPALKKLFEEKAEKDFYVLGGGDIAFPLLLAMSVFFVNGAEKAVIVSASSLVGLGAAYAIHLTIMKGKATPALPPIFVFSLLGVLAVRFVG